MGLGLTARAPTARALSTRAVSPRITGATLPRACDIGAAELGLDGRSPLGVVVRVALGTRRTGAVDGRNFRLLLLLPLCGRLW